MSALMINQFMMNLHSEAGDEPVTYFDDIDSCYRDDEMLDCCIRSTVSLQELKSIPKCMNFFESIIAFSWNIAGLKTCGMQRN